MKYRKLGKTNLVVSVIGIGTWQFGGEWGKTFAQDEVDRMFSRGRDLGLNLIDTAECYGDHLSESLVGNAIHRERDKWVVATKFGHKFDGLLKRIDLRTAADVRRQLEDSLRALRTDYIDLYQFHSVADEEFDDAELHRALEDFVKSGKVRHVGNSVRAKGDPMHQIERSADAHVEAIQIVYNRLETVAEHAFPACQKQNLGVLARVPLASGLLSGKYKPGQYDFPPGDHRSQKDPRELDEKIRMAETAFRLAEMPPGVSMAEWAIAWCLEHPAVTCTIPGCKNVEQVESNAKAADLARDDHPQAAAR